VPFIRLKVIREMTSEERTEKLGELKTELSRTKSKLKVGGIIDDPTRIRELRKAIARILTVQNESKRLGRDEN
jgi:large subunit ribosomal protein L29